jgi:hypothetical protein
MVRRASWLLCHKIFIKTFPVKSNQPSKAALDPVGTEELGIPIIQWPHDVDLKRNDLDITYYRGAHLHYRQY